MTLAQITAPSAVVAAMQEFDDLGREAFLTKYGFGKSRQYFLHHNDKAYDAKAILGAAHGHQSPEAGPLSSTQFNGGEATRRKLVDLGFDVVSEDTVEDEGEESLPIAYLINSVLDLQPSFSALNTAEMQERGRLVTKGLPAAIRAVLPEPSTLSFTASVEGRDGTGSKSRVPWVRVYSQTHSPSAMAGWYVVLLFGAGGECAYLSLGTGVSAAALAAPGSKSQDWLAARVQWARQLLGVQKSGELKFDIDLGDAGSRGRQYEQGTVCAYSFPAGQELEEEAFSARLQHLLGLLGNLYDHGEPDAEESASTTTIPVHLLMKWSPRDPHTMDRHLAVAAEHEGRVWWGNATRGERKVPVHRIATLRHQLHAGEATYAYLYRSGPQPAAWRARVEQVTTDASEVDAERLPAPSDGFNNHSIFVLLSHIEAIDISWMNTHLALESQPVAGSLIAGLKNQQSPMYVVDVTEAASNKSATKPTLAPLLTREWLIDRTLWNPQAVDEVLETLTGPSPQVMLAGPPGTGKSWVAQALARYLTQDRPTHWRLVQFHPNYGYESLIEGLQPVSEAGAIKFERVDGTVLRMAKAARLSEGSHVLVLDEMNRANIPRVFGELMFLFEYREHTVDLQFSQGFALPKNLTFIATMNTADRSIRGIDVALRRRFEIFECLPDAEALQRFYDSNHGTNYVTDLLAGFTALNDALTNELDRHHTIGQSFFMTDEMTPERLNRVWTRQIHPLVEEYFFDQPDVASDFTLSRFWPSVHA